MPSKGPQHAVVLVAGVAMTMAMLLGGCREVPAEVSRSALTGAPVAVLEQQQRIGRPGEPVVFSAERSVDAGSELVAYRWDFDSDGTIDTETTAPIASHVFREPYMGMAMVTVVSADGGTDVATAPVMVVDEDFSVEPPAPPTDVVAAPGTNGGEVSPEWVPSRSGDVGGYRVYLDDGTFIGADSRRRHRTGDDGSRARPHRGVPRHRRRPPCPVPADRIERGHRSRRHLIARSGVRDDQ